MCRIPNEFWMPKIEPLHHVAANTTTQPKPPSGGTKPGPGCALGGVAGRLSGQPVCISCTVLSSGASLHSGSSYSCGSLCSTARCSVCPACVSVLDSSEPGVPLAAPAVFSLLSGCILNGTNANAFPEELFASERVEEKNRNKSPQDLKLSQSRVTLHGWSLIIRSIMPKSCYERSLFIIKQQDFQQTEENTVSARFKRSPKLFALGSHPFYRAPTPPLSFVEYLHRIPVGCSALLTSPLLQYNSGTFRNAHSARDTV